MKEDVKQMNDQKKSKSQVSIITVIMLSLLTLSALVLLYVAGTNYQKSVVSIKQNQQQAVVENIK